MLFCGNRCFTFFINGSNTAWLLGSIGSPPRSVIPAIYGKSSSFKLCWICFSAQLLSEYWCGHYFSGVCSDAFQRTSIKEVSRTESGLTLKADSAKNSLWQKQCSPIRSTAIKNAAAAKPFCDCPDVREHIQPYARNAVKNWQWRYAESIAVSLNVHYDEKIIQAFV